MHHEGDVLRNRYIIQSILGSGGSGFVYLSKDLSIGKLWAIKEIDTHKFFSYELAEGEVNMLKSLDYPMIPRITDAWQEDDACYIVSDYIEGISLGQIINEGPISKIRACDFALQIADALIFLHSQNPPILFLDLKPDNILIKSNGKAFLVDFGIACNAYGIKTGFGTPGFAPPEQYGDKTAACVSERSDIYAFGITYFSMRTGIAPVSNAMEMISIVKENQCISRMEKSFVSNCIQINPDARFASMSILRKKLLRIKKSSISAYIRPFIAVCAMILFAAFFLNHNVISDKKTSEKMMEEVIANCPDGEYNRKALLIMSNYVNSGELDKNDEDYFTFEIARSYFEQFGDYREAKRFFEKLDDDKWPQKEYYLKLCELQTGFDCDLKAISDCLDQFLQGVSLLPDSEKKYNNLLFISFCYSQYYPLNSKEHEKAFEILLNGQEELKRIKENNGWKNTGWIIKMENEYKRRIALMGDEINE